MTYFTVLTFFDSLILPSGHAGYYTRIVCHRKSSKPHLHLYLIPVPILIYIPSLYLSEDLLNPGSVIYKLCDYHVLPYCFVLPFTRTYQEELSPHTVNQW